MTDERYIPKADKWRNTDSFSTYKNFIDCHEVFPNIIIGNIYAARSKPFLKDIGVTHVLNCALNHCLTYNDMKFDQEYYQDYKIKFKGLELDDICTENIARYFDESIEFIDDAMKNGGKILIHCLAGISRSATITIAYLMKQHSMTIEDAIKIVKQNRRVYPNEGFLKQLVELDFKLRKQSVNR
ncbi:dual specificity protein phosphatase 3-like protein [Dermatophagoides farinae]|nr:dual specificity protein phosphatase 3-like protein [Dermatophagoides farinae]